MSVAIIGAGFAAQALAYHFKRAFPQKSVHLFHDEPIDKSASAISTGLLNPYSGPYLTLPLIELDPFSDALELIHQASKYSLSPLIINKGTYRFSSNKRQEKAFSKRAKETNSNYLFDYSQKAFPFSTLTKGLYTENSYTLDSLAYLRALKTLLEKKGVVFIQQKIRSFSELDDFETIFYCGGAKGLSLLDHTFQNKWGLYPIKGQVIEYEISKLPALPLKALCHQKYLIPDFHQKRLLLGSTFEKSFDSIEPQVNQAIMDLKKSGEALFSELTQAKIKKIYSGLRLVSENTFPILGQLNKKTWVLTAFGAKGILYHSCLAKLLVHSLQSAKHILVGKLNQAWL